MQEPPLMEGPTDEPDEGSNRGDSNHRGEARHRDQTTGGESRTLQETLETAASAYFSACRNLARAINRLKQK